MPHDAEFYSFEASKKVDELGMAYNKLREEVLRDICVYKRQEF